MLEAVLSGTLRLCALVERVEEHVTAIRTLVLDLHRAAEVQEAARAGYLATAAVARAEQVLASGQQVQESTAAQLRAADRARGGVAYLDTRGNGLDLLLSRNGVRAQDRLVIVARAVGGRRVEVSLTPETARDLANDLFDLLRGPEPFLTNDDARTAANAEWERNHPQPTDYHRTGCGCPACMKGGGR